MTVPILISAASTLTWKDAIIFGVYILLSIGLGLSVGGKQKDLKTYLLAGHQMHWVMIAISVLAALFSGISFLGAPAETSSHNLVYLWVIVAYFVATPITALVFLPFFFRLDFYTAYEYLEHRFDLRLRRISSASFLFRVCLWLALAIYAPSLVISELTGLPIWLSVLVTGVSTLIYTTVGGMKAVIYTDVMQFTVLILGMGVIFFIALQKIPGGAEGAWKIAEAGGRTQFLNLSWSMTERMTTWGALIGGIFINLVALVTDQISVQRYLTATSLRESQRALWFKLFLTVPLVGLFYFAGLVLYAFYTAHPEFATQLASPDRILPNFVSNQLPSPVPGIFMAAILAATMSTVSSGINSLTTATLIDFIYTKDSESINTAQDQHRVKVARAWTIAYGVLVTVLALGVGRLGTFVETANKITGFLGGPLLGIFFLGVFSRSANAQGALWGVCAGFLSVISVGCFTSVSFMWYAAIGCCVTYAVGQLMSRFYNPPTFSQKDYAC